jgi:hypothetical protein
MPKVQIAWRAATLSNPGEVGVPHGRRARPYVTLSDPLQVRKEREGRLSMAKVSHGHGYRPLIPRGIRAETRCMKQRERLLPDLQRPGTPETAASAVAPCTGTYEAGRLMGAGGDPGQMAGSAPRLGALVRGVVSFSQEGAAAC